MGDRKQPTTGRRAANGTVVPWVLERLTIPEHDVCEPWPFKTSTNHPRAMIDGERQIVQRWIQIQFRGEPTPGFVVTQLCDTPTCMNRIHSKFGVRQYKTSQKLYTGPPVELLPPAAQTVLEAKRAAQKLTRGELPEVAAAYRSGVPIEQIIAEWETSRSEVHRALRMSAAPTQIQRLTEQAQTG